MRITESELRKIIREEAHGLSSPEVAKVIGWAQNGGRVVIEGKTVWGGLGNRSGLHDYARELLKEKWQKSGTRFEKLLSGLPAGTVVELFWFQNINRDRGRWVLESKVVLPAPPA